MPKYAGALTRYPARALFAWYLGLMFVGGTLLTLPICRGASASAPISFLDGLFTATSACCVTGLSVRSTGNDFSLVGQVVIVLWIQLGGIGIITLTTFFTLYWSGTQNLRQRAALAETLGARPLEDMRSVLWRVMLITFGIEGLGAALLFVRFSFDLPVEEAAWYAVFHSVSAFCNAGFGLRDDNLVAYRTDPLVNFTIMILIIVGGIGFPVLGDLYHKRRALRRLDGSSLSLHTKLTLVGTGILLSVGALAILALEWDDMFAHMGWGETVLCSLFQSTTTRTAGFNTVAIGELTDATLFLMILWMGIGAGPCSTAGGFKVSTAMVLATQSWCKFRGRSRVQAFRRTITADTVQRALGAVVLFTAIGVLGLIVILFIEGSAGGHHQGVSLFLDAAFEVTSALGTVGLSTGLTTKLSDVSRVMIIVLMFIGRVGPFSTALVLSRETREGFVEYAKEEVLIG